MTKPTNATLDQRDYTLILALSLLTAVALGVASAIASHGLPGIGDSMDYKAGVASMTMALVFTWSLANNRSFRTAGTLKAAGYSLLPVTGLFVGSFVFEGFAAFRPEYALFKVMIAAALLIPYAGVIGMGNPDAVSFRAGSVPA